MAERDEHRPAGQDTVAGDRTRHWPAIEARYGRPVSYWLDLVSGHAGRRYPEQIALLRESHGFSQAHANAVVHAELELALGQPDAP